MKIRPMGTEFFYAGGRTGKHDDVNSRFSQYSEKRRKCTESGNWVWEDGVPLQAIEDLEFWRHIKSTKSYLKIPSVLFVVTFILFALLYRVYYVLPCFEITFFFLCVLLRSCKWLRVFCQMVSEERAITICKMEDRLIWKISIHVPNYTASRPSRLILISTATTTWNPTLMVPCKHLILWE